jgi:hypothetical protein
MPRAGGLFYVVFYERARHSLATAERVLQPLNGMGSNPKPSSPDGGKQAGKEVRQARGMKDSGNVGRATRAD